MIGDLARGISFKVYRAASGEWHGHVVGVREWELRGLRLPWAFPAVERVAHDVIEKVAAGDFATYSEAVAHYRWDGPIAEVGDNAWTDVGFCATEDEARERCCAIIGWCVGKRLAVATGPEVVPARTIPARREVAFL